MLVVEQSKHLTEYNWRNTPSPILGVRSYLKKSGHLKFQRRTLGNCVLKFMKVHCGQGFCYTVSFLCVVGHSYK